VGHDSGSAVGAVDATTARLVVPFGEATETFTVTFDPDDRAAPADGVAAVQGRGATAKTLWVNEVREWGSWTGGPSPGDRGALGRRAHAVGGPAHEQVLCNADLSAYIRAEGP
jgi:hypothetical protein